MKHLLGFFSLLISITLSAQINFVGFDTTICGNAPTQNYTYTNYNSGSGNSSISGYRVYRNGTQIQQDSGHGTNLKVLKDLQFINDSVGFLTLYHGYGSHEVLKTTDYGNTWVSMNVFGAPNFYGTYIVNEHTAYVVSGYQSFVLIDRNTTNGTKSIQDFTVNGTQIIHDTISGASLCQQDTLKVSFTNNGATANYHFVFSQITTSIQEHTINENSIIPYPNPTTTFFNLDNLPKETSQVQLYAVSGRLVRDYSQQDILRNHFKVEGVQNGVYFIQVHSGNHTRTKKLIKSR